MSTPMTSMNQDTAHIVNITEGEFSRSFEIRKMNVLKSAMVSKEFAAVSLSSLASRSEPREPTPPRSIASSSLP